jgi:transglutaminase-like putative cysteine protease
MNFPGQEPQLTADVIKFVGSGKQTSITPEIQNIAMTLTGTILEKAQQILDYVNSMKKQGYDKNVFMKRTAGGIVKDGYVTGCTDADLAFVAIARAGGMPAKYVETIDESWLREGNELEIHGHQYAEVYDQGAKRWFWVDPIDQRIDILSPRNDGRVVYNIGLDSWDIGITDIDTLVKAYMEFKRKWFSKKNG